MSRQICIVVHKHQRKRAVVIIEVIAQNLVVLSVLRISINKPYSLTRGNNHTHHHPIMLVFLENKRSFLGKRNISHSGCDERYNPPRALFVQINAKKPILVFLTSSD